MCLRSKYALTFALLALRQSGGRTHLLFCTSWRKFSGKRKGDIKFLGQAILELPVLVETIFYTFWSLTQEPFDLVKLHMMPFLVWFEVHFFLKSWLWLWRIYSATPPLRSNAKGSECADVQLVSGGLFLKCLVNQVGYFFFERFS